jgi:hypothetical protein
VLARANSGGPGNQDRLRKIEADCEGDAEREQLRAACAAIRSDVRTAPCSCQLVILAAEAGSLMAPLPRRQAQAALPGCGISGAPAAGAGPPRAAAPGPRRGLGAESGLAAAAILDDRFGHSPRRRGGIHA